MGIHPLDDILGALAAIGILLFFMRYLSLLGKDHSDD